MDASCGRASLHQRGTQRVAGIVLFGLLAAMQFASDAAAQQEAPAEPAPAQIHELVRILDDPAVRSWLKAHDPSAAANVEAAEAAGAPQAPPSRYLVDRLAAVRQHLIDLAAAAPTLPQQFQRAGSILTGELRQGGRGHVLLLIVLFVALGLLAELLLHWAVSGLMRGLAAMPVATLGQTMRAAAIRLAHDAARVLAFAVGSIGTFLASDWPSLLREVVVGSLLVFVIVRATLVVCRFVLSPDDERLRLVPVPTESARHWYRRIAIMVGWFAFGWIAAGLLTTLAFTVPARQLVSYTLGLVLVGIGLEAVWRQPAAGAADDEPRTRRRAASWLLSCYFALLWLLWAASMMPAFWFAVIAFALPASIRLLESAIAHLSLLAAPGSMSPTASTIYGVLIRRGARAVLIVAAALLLARAWNIDLTSLAATDTVATRLLRGAVSAVVIVLVADIVWRIVRALIDSRIGGTGSEAQPDSAESRRRSRMQTLLPILRNVLFVVLITVAGLMVLSAMGVEIAPLIAGAGVAGVAIGFGAQTLVKDIIAGVFYLLDDAFRVGEYIQSGNYKGTVESFSLRSVKLRHHRGPLYTVPFGELGAVENMSRDWVIDKTMIGVTYDTDLDKARKLIKQIGKELAEDPELKPNIIETLKMQGVEQFGDYAIQLRMKMTCKPGEQFVIRRRALAMIKKAFDANGIKFAFPMVQVAGGEAGGAAQAALAMTKPAPPQS
jgi:small-conductance mechanosensitive channel